MIRSVSAIAVLVAAAVVAMVLAAAGVGADETRQARQPRNVYVKIGSRNK